MYADSDFMRLIVRIVFVVNVVVCIMYVGYQTNHHTIKTITLLVKLFYIQQLQ